MKTKKNFVCIEEVGFPPVDIAQDESITISEILYRVSNGLPTGLSPSFGDYDPDDDEDIDVLSNYDDVFEVMDAVSEQMTDEQPTSAEAQQSAVGSEATQGSKAPTAE